jgi:acetoin utilization deacetylase AcuC-like enzyme
MVELSLFYPEGHAAHAQTGHPERPERVEVVRQALERAGWWQPFPRLEPLPLALEQLAAVHDPAYLATLEAYCRRGQSLDSDTFTRPVSWQLALNAAGGAAAVARSVWQGQAQRGFALTRPPGHHATRRRGMGFCLINNVAVAADTLIHPLEDSPAGAAERLAIVDLDLHHGNGTQDIFWERSDVFYVSTHQSPFYPGTGSLDDTGAGLGQGYTANFPLPAATGDEGFQAIMETLILPLLDRRQPQMLLVSLGFDPHWRDPLGYLNLSAQGCHALIKSLVQWADAHCSGKIALFLEGGYDLEAGRACTLAAAAALLDRPFTDPLGPSPETDNPGWRQVVRAAREIWKL